MGLPQLKRVWGRGLGEEGAQKPGRPLQICHVVLQVITAMQPEFGDSLL